MKQNIDVLEEIKQSDNTPATQIDLLTNFLYKHTSSTFTKRVKINNDSNKKPSADNNSKWFDWKCHEAKQEFKKARNAFKRNKSNDNRLLFTRARTKYNKIRRSKKYKFKVNEGQRLENIAKTQPKKFWKTLKKCSKKSDNKSNEVKIEDLYDHFNTLLGQIDDTEEDDFEFINNQDNELDAPITEEEIRKAVFKQKNNNASGPDELSAEIIKASYVVISPYLVSIFNNLFNNSKYPDSWSLGYIVPIFKGGDKSTATNYRGITLNNILAKIYSQTLLNRLDIWSEKYEKVSRCQFGHQKGKSTTDCIFILHSILAKVLNSGQKLYSIFIDYEKAYDTVNRHFLWQKLLNENVSSKMIKALKAMYSSVRSVIKYNNNVSNCIKSHLGVKQGDPCSSLLFMMFINDIISNIDSDLNGIFTIDELNIFLILYADDQVLFASSPDSLQSMLHDIEIYCNTWGLKINVKKTKVLIFEKCNRHTSYDFYLYGEKIEVVSSFKYLGVIFFKNGNWNRTVKCIAEHASKALHKVFSIFNNYEFKIYEKCKLFDVLVASVLNYASEVWGYNEGKDIEIIHTKFLGRILCVNKSTNLIGLYGESGRVPLYVMRKVHMFRYWIKLLKSNESSLEKHVYQMLRHDADNNITYNNLNWALHIKTILETLGLSNFWISQDILINQENCYSILSVIKQRIFDQYKQIWYSDINNSQRLISYSRFKHTFELEAYLDNIKNRKFKIALCRFRLSSHKLEIERGRYHNIPRSERICKFCTQNVVENEYHFLLTCPLYTHLRKQYLKQYYYRWPTLNKFDKLMGSTNRNEILNVSKYIFYADKLRNELDIR